jgi:hypothetical protein
MKDLLWKTYFWFITLIIALFVVFLFTQKLERTGLDWLSDLLLIPSWIGVYAYAYRKVVFNSFFWRGVFWPNVLLSLWGVILSIDQVRIAIPAFLRFTGIDVDFTIILIWGLFSFPLLYILYQLSYNQNWSVRPKGKKISFNFINPLVTVWWKISAIPFLFFAVIDFSTLSFESSEKDALFNLTRGVINVILAIFLWKRVNAAFLLTLAYFGFFATIQLIIRNFNNLILLSPFIILLTYLLLKTYRGILKQ